MADCASPFVRCPFRVSFPKSLLLLFVLSAAVVAPANARVPVVVNGLVTDPSGGVLSAPGGESDYNHVLIDNATDAVYDSALGYPGLPRAVVARGRFTLGV